MERIQGSSFVRKLEEARHGQWGYLRSQTRVTKLGREGEYKISVNKVISYLKKKNVRCNSTIFWDFPMIL